MQVGEKIQIVIKEFLDTGQIQLGRGWTWAALSEARR